MEKLIKTVEFEGVNYPLFYGASLVVEYGRLDGVTPFMKLVELYAAAAEADISLEQRGALFINFGSAVAPLVGLSLKLSGDKAYKDAEKSLSALNIYEIGSLGVLLVSALTQSRVKNFEAVAEPAGADL